MTPLFNTTPRLFKVIACWFDSIGFLRLEVFINPNRLVIHLKLFDSTSAFSLPSSLFNSSSSILSCCLVDSLATTTIRSLGIFRSPIRRGLMPPIELYIATPLACYPHQRLFDGASDQFEHLVRTLQPWQLLLPPLSIPNDSCQLQLPPSACNIPTPSSATTLSLTICCCCPSSSHSNCGSIDLFAARSTCFTAPKAGQLTSTTNNLKKHWRSQSIIISKNDRTTTASQADPPSCPIPSKTSSAHRLCNLFTEIAPPIDLITGLATTLPPQTPGLKATVRSNVILILPSTAPHIDLNRSTSTSLHLHLQRLHSISTTSSPGSIPISTASSFYGILCSINPDLNSIITLIDPGL
ncbi:hypothetical protein PGT21_009956 [Puccinia graminis f. sp. tritici]|uniref:Uncharacterized protein n=1 Tax=Puccinia graminis f. sp. tritici TaxID=56615 RepID=A0A5B0ND74_PUCGR|nr:hypothetical protein PGT21_009956 [Puccinia graminis f. sp. tritici]